ncbi:MAG TPA: biotin/lipoyl-containing protein, partial [Devosia sp.]|nr:biotin/lipoyl-containing protein [Devosia sp.]
MATDIRVPALGESVTEATIGQWFKKVGDTVAADEPVVELETDKVTIEVPAPQAGVLQAIAANPGDTVNVGALIGAIGEGGAAPAPKPAEAPKPAAAQSAAAPAAPAAASAPANGASVPPAPSAQKLMSENGLSASDVNGSGRHGQVLKEDVLAAMNKPAAPAQSAATGSATLPPRTPAVADAPKVYQPAPASAPAVAPAPAPAPASAPRAPVAQADEAREERVKMTRLRATIARRLKDAQNTAAMLTTFNEV